MSKRADGVRAAYPLFQAEGGGSTPTSALQLFFGRLDLGRTLELNRLWHSRLPDFPQHCAYFSDWLCYAAEFDGLLFAVALWTAPAARRLPQAWLELRRLAIAPDAPKNTASRMLGWMARDIAKRRPSCPRLVSFSDMDVHTGCIYRAAGWSPTVIGGGVSWDMPNRKRTAKHGKSPKQRWEKPLRGIAP